MKNKLKVNDRVKSTYRARWTGVIIDITPNKETIIATVRVTIDRNGRPLRKPIIKKLGISWLERVIN